jgi:hypothetical protein
MAVSQLEFVLLLWNFSHNEKIPKTTIVAIAISTMSIHPNLWGGKKIAHKQTTIGNIIRPGVEATGPLEIPMPPFYVSLQEQQFLRSSKRDLRFQQPSCQNSN